MSQMLTDLKEHLARGEELLASHIPGLVEWAEKAEADPLVQAAIDLAVPPSARAMLASMLKAVEAELQKAEQEAAAAAHAPAADEPDADAPAAPGYAPGLPA